MKFAKCKRAFAWVMAGILTIGSISLPQPSASAAEATGNWMKTYTSEMQNTAFDGNSAYTLSAADTAEFAANLKKASSMEISVTFKYENTGKSWISLFELFNKESNRTGATAPVKSMALMTGTHSGNMQNNTVYWHTGAYIGSTDWQADGGQAINDNAYHTLTASISASGFHFQVDGRGIKTSESAGSKNTANFCQAFFGGSAAGYEDWREQVDGITIGGFSDSSCFKHANYSNFKGIIKSVTIKTSTAAYSADSLNAAHSSGADAAKAELNALLGSVSAGNYNADKWNEYTSSQAYITASGIVSNSSASTREIYAAIDNLHPVISTLKGEVDLSSIGSGISAMFDNSADNTWLFGGGVETQGRFAEIGGIRNYVGQFEEYIRWTKATANQQIRQRYMINVGKKDMDITAFEAKLDSYITNLQPKAVDYMIGHEDYDKGQDGIEPFKTALASVITKATAMKNQGGYMVIQLPHAVKDTAANANIQLYINAVREVINQTDSTLLNRIVVADHYTQTNNDTFKNSKLNSEDLLNGDGHYELAKQLAMATIKTDVDFPALVKWTEKEAPDQYLDIKPAVTAGQGSLSVSIPEESVSSDEWKYILDINDTEIVGTAAGSEFVIDGLANGADYTLILRTADGTKQLAEVSGRIEAGSEDTSPALTELQQAIRDKADADQPLTWLFMGDSITHAALWTKGYDGIAQIVEKYVKEDLGREDDIIINTGNSSATTTSTLESIDQRLMKYTPDIASVMLGTNDTLSNSEYKNNLQTIINKIKEKNPDALIILRSPTPANGGNYDSKITGGYLQAMKEAAEENNAIFIDQFSGWVKEFEAYSYLFGDHYYFGNFLHPGAAGQLWMAQKFIRECGLRTDTRIGELAYEFSYTDTDSAVVPSVVSAQNSILISKTALQEAYGSETIQEITAILTDTQTQRTYTKSSGLEGNRVAFTNLPTDRTYRVDVTAMIGGGTAKRVSFASRDVALHEGQKADYDVILSTANGAYLQDTSADAEAGALSVDELAPAGNYTYSLVSGEGSSHNAFFSIEGSTLKIQRALQADREYSIRVKAQNGEESVETVFVLKTMPTLASARKEASDAFGSDQTGLDVDVSDVIFNGSTSVDLASPSDSHYANGAYLVVLNKLRESSTGGTIVYQFSTETNGTIFGIGSTLADDGSNMISGVQNGNLRNLFRIASGNNLKGSMLEGIANGSTHTVAISFDTEAPGHQNQVLMSVDGGANIYNTTWWTDGFRTWFNMGSQEISKFVIGGNAAGLGVFNGSIDFVTVTDRIYNETELRAITGAQPADQPEIPETLLIEGEQKIQVENGQIKVSEGAAYTASPLTWDENQENATFILEALENNVFSGESTFDITIPEELDCEVSDIQIQETSVTVTLTKRKHPGAEERKQLEEALNAYAGELASGKDLYTADSYAAFEQAYKNAQEALERGETDAEALSGLLNALNAAKEGLEKKATDPEVKPGEEEKKQLQGVVDSHADAIQNGSTLYTEDSFAAFKKAYEDAQAALKRGETDASVLKGLMKALTDAAGKLQKKETDNTKPPVQQEPGNNEDSIKKGDSIKKKGVKYVVLNPEKKTVAAVKGTKKKAKKVTIASTVKIKGVTCKVTQVKANAFKNYRSLKTLIVGKNVARIGKKAFYGCKKLSRITFKGKKVPKIGSKAFKGISPKVKVSASKLPKKQKKTLVKRLKTAGISKKLTL